MNLVIYSQKTSKEAMYALFAGYLLENQTPVLIMGNQGFPFRNYIQYTRVKKIPFWLSGKLQVASAVNMHHIRSILHYLENRDFCPIFFNISEVYMDDKIDRSISTFLFKRDLRHLSKISSINFIFEYRRSRFMEERKDFIQILLQHSDLYIDDSKGIIKNHLTKKQEEKIYGRFGPYLFNFYGGNPKRMEYISKSPE